MTPHTDPAFAIKHALDREVERRFDAGRMAASLEERREDAGDARGRVSRTRQEGPLMRLPVPIQWIGVAAAVIAAVTGLRSFYLDLTSHRPQPAPANPTSTTAASPAPPSENAPVPEAQEVPPAAVLAERARPPVPRRPKKESGPPPAVVADDELATTERRESGESGAVQTPEPPPSHHPGSSYSVARPPAPPVQPIAQAGSDRGTGEPRPDVLSGGSPAPATTGLFVPGRPMAAVGGVQVTALDYGGQGLMADIRDDPETHATLVTIRYGEGVLRRSEGVAGPDRAARDSVQSPDPDLSASSRTPDRRWRSGGRNPNRDPHASGRNPERDPPASSGNPEQDPRASDRRPDTDPRAISPVPDRDASAIDGNTGQPPRASGRNPDQEPRTMVPGHAPARELPPLSGSGFYFVRSLLGSAEDRLQQDEHGLLGKGLIVVPIREWEVWGHDSQTESLRKRFGLRTVVATDGARVPAPSKEGPADASLLSGVGGSVYEVSVRGLATEIEGEHRIEVRLSRKLPRRSGPPGAREIKATLLVHNGSIAVLCVPDPLLTGEGHFGTRHGGKMVFVALSPQFGNLAPAEWYEGRLVMERTSEPPVAIDTPEPEYPDEARQLGVEGKVIVRALIRRDGSVDGVQVLDVPGVPGAEFLIEPAASAVRKCRYIPARVEGDLVNGYITMTVEFSAAEGG